MMRRLSSTLIVMVMMALFVAHPVRAAKSYYAESFDVQIDIQEDGSILVRETVEFQFSGDPFTFAFREISAANTDGITFLEASMDGVRMPLGTQPGEVEVKEGDPLEVTWHFEPTSNTSHIFVVRYQADGVIRKGDADTLIWRAIPEDHDYSIVHSTIVLTYPSNALLLEQPTLNWDFDAAWEDDRLILTAGGLAENQDLILSARFTPDSLTRVAPRWQIQSEQAEAAASRALPFGFIAGFVTLVIGCLGLFTYIRANGRDLTIPPVISTANPPSDLPPAVVGKLTGQDHTFMGTVFDLAQRGVVEVREENGLWGMKTHVLVRRSQPASLKPHEQGLMEALFAAGESQIPMNEISTRLAMKNKLFAEPLEEELIQRGWLDPERKHRRILLAIGGVLMLILSMLVFIFSVIGAVASLPENPSWLPALFILAGISAGLFILSIPLLIYAGMYSILTPAGEEHSARWKGFAEYLKQVSKGREPTISSNYFERYLAYAAVFGLGANWAKYFQKLGGVPLPIWFHATADSNGDFGAMVAVMSASDSAGASGGGDGGGASGGGSSGAG
ncbi:MAG: DUF2207 domain-containing protein [Anaerolineales bacterium]